MDFACTSACHLASILCYHPEASVLRQWLFNANIVMDAFSNLFSTQRQSYLVDNLSRLSRDYRVQPEVGTSDDAC